MSGYEENGTWVCPICGNINSADEELCSVCGTINPQKNSPDQVEELQVAEETQELIVTPASGGIEDISWGEAGIEDVSEVEAKTEAKTEGKRNGKAKGEGRRFFLMLAAVAILAVASGAVIFGVSNRKASEQNKKDNTIALSSNDETVPETAQESAQEPEQEPAEESKDVPVVITQAPEITVEDINQTVKSSDGTDVYTTVIQYFTVDAEQFPWLAEQLNGLNQYFERQRDRYTGDAEEQVENARVMPFDFSAYTTITRCDTQYVSIMVSGTFYQNGPISHWSKGFTYDIQNQKPVFFEDVFTSESAAVDAAITCLDRDVEQIDMSGYKNGNYMINQFKNSDAMTKDGSITDIDLEGSSWSLTEDGAYFYFDANYINPGSFSSYYTEVKAAEYPDIFNSAVSFGNENGVSRGNEDVSEEKASSVTVSSEDTSRVNVVYTDASSGDVPSTDTSVRNVSNTDASSGAGEFVDPLSISEDSIKSAGDLFDDWRSLIYTRGKDRGIMENASEIREYTVLHTDSGDGDNNILVEAIELSVHFSDDEWFSWYNYIMIPDIELDADGNVKDMEKSDFSLKEGESKFYEHSGESFEYKGYDDVYALKADIDARYGAQGYSYTWHSWNIDN